MKERTIGRVLPARKRIKAHIFEGKNKESKNLLLTAGIHGDEITSILVLQDLLPFLERIEGERLHGKVTVVPICNPEAFRYKNRGSPADSQDLNRVFPGDSDGGLTERIAASIWKLAQESDYILDLHCCGLNCYPYILTLHTREIVTPFVRHIPWRLVVQSHGTEGQLFIEALKEDIPAAILEIRGGNSRLDVKDRQKFGHIVRNLLKNLDFLQADGKHIEKNFLGRIQQIRTQKEGIFIPKVEAGDIVEKKEKIGEIDGEPISSSVSGKVIKLSQPAIMFPGDPVAGIASNKKGKRG